MLNQIKQQSGQSLIEVLVALSITAIVLGGLVIAVLVSLKNAQFAQNQAKATKYAQEAIDQVKTIRDRDLAVTFISNKGSACQSSCSFGINCYFSDLWSCQLSTSATSPCTVSPPGETGCYFNLTDTPALNEPDLPIYIDQSIGNGLTRKIQITDDGTTFDKEKNVIVKVIWSDASGQHESNLQTKLTKH